MTTLEFTSSPSETNWLKRGLLGSLVLVILLALLFAVSGALSTRPGTLTLKTSGLQFSETEIHAQVGQPVNLELFNLDGYAHGFDIDEFGIHIELPGSKTIPLTFTPTQAGTYTFYCGAYGHKNAGMVGTLIVEP